MHQGAPLTSEALAVQDYNRLVRLPVQAAGKSSLALLARHHPGRIRLQAVNHYDHRYILLTPAYLHQHRRQRHQT